jgi:hypothetical protein
MKTVALVAVAVFMLALAIGWIRPTGVAVPILALALLLARIAVGIFGTRRGDVPHRAKDAWSRSSEDQADEADR